VHGTSSLILSFPLSSAMGGGFGTTSFDKYSLGSRGSVSGRSYIPETNLVGWALMNGQHASQFFISDSF
jgi:hypothetical protein